MNATILAAVLGVAGVAGFDPSPVVLIPDAKQVHWIVQFTERDDESGCVCHSWEDWQASCGYPPLGSRVTCWEWCPARWTRYWWDDVTGALVCDDPSATWCASCVYGLKP